VTGPADFRLTVDGTAHDVSVGPDSITVDGQTFGARVERTGRNVVVLVDGRPYFVEVGEMAGDLLIVGVDGAPREVELGSRAQRARVPAARPSPPPSPSATGAATAQRPSPSAALRPGRGGGNSVLAPMAGRVTRVAVSAGDTVEPGDLLLILEAMKMENEIRATHTGIIERILAEEGSRVSAGEALIELR